MGAVRFACSPGGAVAAGRRRLRRLLGVPVALMAVLALALLLQGRLLPALLAAGVGLLVHSASRLGGELEPRRLEIEEGRLTLVLARRRLEVPIGGGAARRLDGDEIRHLERLASRGGMVAGSGGFDSHRLGEFDLYASDLERAVLIEAAEARLVVTPDQPEAFVEALRRAARPA